MRSAPITITRNPTTYAAESAHVCFLLSGAFGVLPSDSTVVTVAGVDPYWTVIF